tara:strand:- start:2309 stop:3565 length:1257 start_codon:yes stop_codon:yes gene_type:complete
MIEMLRKRTIENTGLTMTSLGHCIQLSNYILEKHDTFISYNTLRRFFGVIANETKPSALTLDILSRFNGYKNYMHFSRLFKYDNQWKLQNDIYEIMNHSDTRIFIEEIEKKINKTSDFVSILVQVVRELLLEKRYDDVIGILSIKQLEISNISYDEAVNVANGIGSLLRTKNIEEKTLIKLLNVANYRSLVFSVFVDYSNLNGYYSKQIKILKKMKIEEDTMVFSKCIENLYLYLNLKPIRHKTFSVKNEFHPILKSRIISQELLNATKNTALILESFYQKISTSSLKIEHFYELIVTAMITKNKYAMSFIINRIDGLKGEIFLYQLRHKQQYLLMKALYLSATGSKKSCKEIIEDFNPNGVAESYKEFLNVFYLITQYNIAEDLEKEKLIAKYSNLAEKLSYPLFNEEYIRNYNFKD